MNTIGSGSVPVGHVYDSGILSEPMMIYCQLPLSNKLMYHGWIYNSSCLTSLKNTIGPCSAPVDSVCDAGILPWPLMTYCQLYLSNILMNHEWRLPLRSLVNTIGPGSVPVDHLYDAGILPEPNVHISSLIPKKYDDVSWVKITFISLRLMWIINISGPGSVPVDHVYDAGILSGPMLTCCQLCFILK